MLLIIFIWNLYTLIFIYKQPVYKELSLRIWFVKAVLTTEQIWDISQGVKTTDATYGWHMCGIRVTYKYIRDGWHTSTYEWHIGGVLVTYGWHPSKFE